MNFNIRMGIPEMQELWLDLQEKYRSGNIKKKEEQLYKKWGKALKLLSADPGYPSLQTHEIEPLSGRYGNIMNAQSVNRAIKRVSSAYNATEEIEAKKEHREPVLLPDFSAHSLRHTFCTRLCERETNLKIIQSIMGHKDIQTTMDIYAEATEEKKQETFEHLAATMDVF